LTGLEVSEASGSRGDQQPIFVIEREYLLPIYQHLVIEASDLTAACKKAVEGGTTIGKTPSKAVIARGRRRSAALNSCR